MCLSQPLASINGRAGELARYMAEDSRLAFEPWETALLSQIAGHQPGNLVAFDSEGQELIAGIVGGRCGKRGTISHAWVHPNFRGRRIGDELALDAARAMAKAGAEVIHLMVTGDNQDALKFWERLGFTKVRDRLTLECDLGPEIVSDEEFDRIELADLDELCADLPESRERLEAFLAHDSTGFVAREDGRILGYVFVGSLGVRGFIEHCSAESTELACRLIQHAFAWLYENGVARAHYFVAESDPMINCLLAIGMRHDPSETTLEYYPVTQVA